ncbi:hypothetical protein PEBR_23086 [Penicillium brasilianum]|uniref:Uncharacterized protein n=1 Tax=Penicillium brasilianum TaxID=104259 RepID=A0A1S9RKD9_PENBI|nr:hypothetical protein PEBR_23086 [Penicillium brasilianum]
MSAPGGAPSPAPRGGSMGPGASGGNMPMSSQQPMSGTPVHSAPPPGPPPPQSGAMSQQNLNQIVEITKSISELLLHEETSRYFHVPALNLQSRPLSVAHRASLT